MNVKLRVGFGELKSQIAISKIVGARVDLQKNGHRLKGLCPFHNEKTPSFTVDDNEGFYHCFGCGAHGDVFDFVQNYDRLPSFAESLKLVCAECGIEVDHSLFVPESKDKYADLYRATELFAEWCSGRLTAGFEGTGALNYLRSRGVLRESIAKFRLGYCPNDNGPILAFMREHNISREVMCESGILNSGNRPVFGGRIIFPVLNEKSKVIAFGARDLTGHASKYINSPEYALFKKSRSFYGLSQARGAALKKKEIIVVEGYFDVIMLHQFGITNVVAAMGTAFSGERLASLWQIVPNVCVCFDGDSAGNAAMDKIALEAVKILKSAEYGLSFTRLPEGCDPADIARKSQLSFLSERIDLAERIFNKVSDGMDISLPGNRAKIESRLSAIAGKIPNPILAGHYKQYFRSRLYSKLYHQKKSCHTQEREPITRTADALTDKICISQIALVITEPSILNSPAVEEDFLSVDADDMILRNIKDFILNSFYDNVALQSNDLLLELKKVFSCEKMYLILRVVEVIRKSGGDVSRFFAEIMALWCEFAAYDEIEFSVDVPEDILLPKCASAAIGRRNVMRRINELMSELVDFC